MGGENSKKKDERAGENSQTNNASYPLEGPSCRLEETDEKTQERFDQYDLLRGMFETELFQYENDPQLRWDMCRKNPGHPNFIPRKEFGIQHLPAHVQHPVFVDYFNCMADFVCLLEVSIVSPDRPDNLPFATLRGSSSRRVGSGIVHPFYSVLHTDTPCLCSSCSSSSDPYTDWVELEVRTAAHVVCDNIEAKATKVLMFYDSDEDKSNGRVCHLQGIEVFRCNVVQDRCRIKCCTHDSELYQRLQDMGQRCMELRQKVDGLYTKMEIHQEWLGNVCVIPSHPHGRHKHVTVGQVSHRQGKEDVLHIYDTLVYKTDTCPGSSGAPVVWLGRVERMRQGADGSLVAMRNRRERNVYVDPGFTNFSPHSRSSRTRHVNYSASVLSNSCIFERRWASSSKQHGPTWV